MYAITRHAHLKPLVLKNLDASTHRKRNLKTAIMFAICLAFLIFASVNFTLIAGMIEAKLEETLGSDLYGVTIDYEHMTSMIDDDGITKFLTEQRRTSKDVISWTFVSHDLN